MLTILYRLRYFLFFVGLALLLWGILKPTPPPYLFEHSDKVFHFLAFISFSLITRYAFLHQPGNFIWLYLLVSAPLLEFLQQYLLQGRSFSMGDVIANITGIVIAFVIWKISVRFLWIR